MEEKDKDLNEAIKNTPGEFSFFITSLGMQALVALGEIPNPTNNKKESNLDQAKYIIDTIGMLKDKTKGNLTQEEEAVVDNILYELRMKYLELTKEKKGE
jgi:hypothetical protein